MCFKRTISNLDLLRKSWIPIWKFEVNVSVLTILVLSLKNFSSQIQTSRPAKNQLKSNVQWYDAIHYRYVHISKHTILSRFGRFSDVQTSKRRRHEKGLRKLQPVCTTIYYSYIKKVYKSTLSTYLRFYSFCTDQKYRKQEIILHN
jgi:hypothetical protein